MASQQLFDSMPILGVLVAFALAAIITSEIGFRHGRWWQARSPEEKEGPAAMIVGSLLALMAFLLAVAMGMAADRFDTRRGLVLLQANSVGTTYLRAGYLPEPASSEIRQLLRDYVPLIIVGNDPDDVVKNKIAVAGELHKKMWAITERLARQFPESDLLALFVESLNETIDVHAMRVTAGVYARVPSTVIVLLLLGSMLTLAMVGYTAGLSGRRSSLTGAILIVILAAVISLVIDLDRPRDGFLTVKQQPLIDLQAEMGVLNR